MLTGLAELEVGTICFLTSVVHDRALGVDWMNSVVTTFSRLGWEEWRIEPDGCGHVAFQAISGGCFLSCRANGSIVMSKEFRSSVLWKLQPSSQGGYFIKSVEHGLNLSSTSGGYVGTSPDDESSTEWHVEDARGMLVCLQSSSGRFVRCSSSGQLSTGKTRSPSDVFRVVQTGNPEEFFITSAAHGFHLGSHRDSVAATDMRGFWNRWKLQIHGAKCTIKSVNGAYLCPSAEGNLLVESKEHFWTLIPPHGNRYYLISAKGNRYIGCGPERNLYATTDCTSSQQWVLREQDDLVMLQSATSRGFLSSNATGEVSLQSGAGLNERWQLVIVGPRVYKIVSKQTGRYLARNKSSTVNTTIESDFGDFSQLWLLEPCLSTDAKSNHQILNWAAVGTLAVAGAVAAPFIATAVIASMGFTATGITAGSVAAGMMSAEAIAAGGGIAATGVVATLQSIGAVGLGVGGVAATATAGTVVGGTVGLAGSAAVSAISSVRSTLSRSS